MGMCLSFSRVEHDPETGMAKTFNVDLTPLITVIRLPLSAEEHLFATADSLGYDAIGLYEDKLLREDLRRILLG
jgi:hypothetical protein